MVGFVTAPQRTFVRSLFLMVAGFPLLVLTGCGLGSSKSENQSYEDHQKGLGKLMVAAGGTADLKVQSMGGMTVEGWTIDLSGAKVTDQLVDKMIEMVAAYPILELDLSKTAITDAQLGKLDKGKVFVRVVNLDLSDTKITDAGLDQITMVGALTKLNLKGSGATKEGGERLGQKKIANPGVPAFLKNMPEITI